MTKKEITQLSYEITGFAIKVHKTLGPGLLESIYEECLKIELINNGYDVKQQLFTTINYEGVDIKTKLVVDLLVNDAVIVELKAIEEILPIHEAQLLTYMKVLKKPQGLLINFFTDNITKSLKPFINEYFKELPN
ncbi:MULTISPECIES: GxxExxY protein [Chryseobacterium]|uniref:GxxExxY protein n=1 Tax=Chryseobacterium TaxID=59732 RepID=UPI000D36B257|nr:MULTISPECIES: GxxExxY protein [Chryseobacterium]MCQ4140674.1 GxxExxY protein [Chryseobacterium sp. EO14]MCY1659781.1 GxxExxY protein [Chryseobacterium sp. SL1]PTT77447.1 GxxExxY protein [Chryseobacterium sp. HMWF001]PVV61897.1 GxxExxY protein [Chryseobacterium sp. HMWF035]WBV51519.1 GxxExxY protein [Chryseobacterium gambrini]